MYLRWNDTLLGDFAPYRDYGYVPLRFGGGGGGGRTSLGELEHNRLGDSSMSEFFPYSVFGKSVIIQRINQKPLAEGSFHEFHMK